MLPTFLAVSAPKPLIKTLAIRPLEASIVPALLASSPTSTSTFDLAVMLSNHVSSDRPASDLPAGQSPSQGRPNPPPNKRSALFMPKKKPGMRAQRPQLPQSRSTGSPQSVLTQNGPLVPNQTPVVSSPNPSDGAKLNLGRVSSPMMRSSSSYGSSVSGLAEKKPAVPKKRTYQEYDIVSLGTSQVALRSLGHTRMEELVEQGILKDNEQETEYDDFGQPIKTRLNIMHFGGPPSQPPPDLFSLAEPIMMNRKDPTYVPPPPVVEEVQPVIEKKITPYSTAAEIAAQVEIMAAQNPTAQAFNIPLVNLDGTPLIDAKTGEHQVKVVANPNLIAPGPSSKAAMSRSSSKDREGKGGKLGKDGKGNEKDNKRGGRWGRKFEEKVKMKTSSVINWAEVNKEKLPWVLEEAGPGEVPVDPENPNAPRPPPVQKWVGRLEGGTEDQTSGWVAMMFVNNEIILQPVHKEYRFEPKRRIETIASDMVYRTLESQMQGRQTHNSRWMLRTSEDQLDTMEEGLADEDASSARGDVKPSFDVKPRIGRDPYAPVTRGRRPGPSSFAVKLEERRGAREVKPKIKREQWDDDQGTRGRGGMEAMEGEGLDYEDTGAQSDEEGIAVGEEEEEAQKELLARQREEQQLANRNVGVLNRGSDDESDDDIFGEKAERREAEEQAKRQRRKMRRKLRRMARERGEEIPDDDESDEEGSYISDEESDSSEEEDVKPDIVKLESGTNPSPNSKTKSRRGTTSPSPGPGSRTGSPHGTRSQSPASGFGHQLMAARAISPGRTSRAGSPSGSVKGSRKRKGDHATAPPEGSGFSTAENSERMSKKHRSHTDSGPSAPLSSQNAAYLPSPESESGPSTPGEGHDMTTPKHKARGKKKRPLTENSMSPPLVPGARKGKTSTSPGEFSNHFSSHDSPLTQIGFVHMQARLEVAMVF